LRKWLVVGIRGHRELNKQGKDIKMSIKKMSVLIILILFTTITSAKETLFDLPKVEEGLRKRLMSILSKEIFKQHSSNICHSLNMAINIRNIWFHFTI
jgi:hypothetical protein